MRSLVSLAAALLAATPLAAQTPPLPPEAGTPSGPAGTAGAGAPSRYDAVQWAQVDPALVGIALAAALPVGSHAEVTALSSGRTILLPVTATAADVSLSPAAAQLLGLDVRAGVRVRAVTAGPADAVALRQGLPASARLDTPDTVLRALRRQLPAVAVASARHTRVPRAPVAAAKRPDYTVADASPPPPTALKIDTGVRTVDPVPDVPATRLVPPAAAAAAPVTSRFVVNVQTVPQEERARNAARTLRGTAIRGADGWLIRLGPFANLPAAQAARDDAVARGYADAAIFIAD